MALKARLKSIDDLPEEVQKLYTHDEESGEYVLQVEDPSAKDREKKLKEFRDNNIHLAKEKEELQAKLEQFKDVDPEEYRKLKKEIEEKQDKDLLDQGKVDELVQARTERMRQEYEGKVSSLGKSAEDWKARAEQAESRLSSMLIDHEVQKAIQKVATPRPGAMDDILSRAKRVWRLNDKQEPVPQQGDGTIIYGKDGKEIMTMPEWAEGLVQEAPFLFEGNTGGGANGSDADRGHKGTQKTVKHGDALSFGKNLEGIAKGEVQVIR